MCQNNTPIASHLHLQQSAYPKREVLIPALLPPMPPAPPLHQVWPGIAGPGSARIAWPASAPSLGVRPLHWTLCYAARETICRERIEGFLALKGRRRAARPAALAYSLLR
jgi:hypothetical protein